MDIVMSYKDGIEALKEIKEMKPNIKVVMASSVGTMSILTPLKNGAYDFIHKPITLDAVVNLIEKVLKEGRIIV